ncbi:MAG: electron transfer flavoprotein subunit alpha/FixB family protein [Spirochaetaceae bacterium]|nr:electron transfer flavoprotein subunit alpha/FixB family protein [Spirochaetaceae bacterium]
MAKTLVYIDGEDVPQEAALLAAACRVYPGKDDEVYAASLDDLPTGDCRGFDGRIRIKSTGIEPWDVSNIVDCLEALYRTYRFDCILTGVSRWGARIAPALAMRLRTGLIAEVTEINRAADLVEFIRPAYSGKLYACIRCKSVPVMASINLNSFEPETSRVRAAKTIPFFPPLIRDTGIVLLKKEKRELPYDIRDCELLVSGGGGAARYFNKLNALAAVLGGKVAASRSIVDQGIAGREIQVGQSGKTVSPRLYFAVGIHGSLQHIEGLKDVETIISVNTDKNAPLCCISDLVVEGDGSAFIDKLIAFIASQKSE